MAPLRVHEDPTEFAKKALLKVFQDVTLKHAATTQWSTWHMWDYVDRLAPLPAGVESHIWADMAPFASCLGQAHLIQRDIQTALSDDEDLSSNFNESDIALITTKESSTSDYDYHVVVAVMFQGFCIVADPSLHSTALVVGMNQTKTCEERMLLSGRPGKGTYNYFKDNNGTYSLVTTLGNSPDWRRFECEIDHATAVHNLAIPSARELVPEGPNVPVSKLVALRSLFDYDPVCYHSTRVGNKYLVAACQIKINFAERKIQMQIPFEDWLWRVENQAFKDRIHHQNAHLLRQYEAVDGKESAAVELRLELGAMQEKDLGVQMRRDIVLMSEIGEKFGLAKDDFLSIVKGVYRAWSRVDAGVKVPDNWP